MKSQEAKELQHKLAMTPYGLNETDE